jgi:uncharacterized peroxidase-related enzyme|tara:strand:- start:219 stop:815 length:597 start_codon:yes stop_codon:yes gene_type:complete
MSKIEKQEAKEKITALKLEKKLNYEDQKNASNYLKVVNEKIGFVPNVLKAFSNFPKQFEGFTKLYNSIMLGESGLSKLEREMIAVTVSSENQCFYCLAAHGATVRELSQDPQLGERLASNFEAANLSKKHKTMLLFARNLTRNPSIVNEEDRRALNKVGFNDRDIWDISLVVGFFNMTNRLAIASEMEPNDIYHNMHR